MGLLCAPQGEPTCPDVSPHAPPPLTVLQDEPTSPRRLSPCTLYPDGPPSPWVPGHTALLRASLRGCLPTAARPPSRLGGPTRRVWPGCPGWRALTCGPWLCSRPLSPFPLQYSPRDFRDEAGSSVFVCSFEGEGAPWPPGRRRLLGLFCHHWGWGREIAASLAGAGGGARLPGWVCSCASMLSVLSTRPCALPLRQSHRAPTHTRVKRFVFLSGTAGAGVWPSRWLAGYRCAWLERQAAWRPDWRAVSHGGWVPGAGSLAVMELGSCPVLSPAPPLPRRTMLPTRVGGDARSVGHALWVAFQWGVSPPRLGRRASRVLQVGAM